MPKKAPARVAADRLKLQDKKRKTKRKQRLKNKKSPGKARAECCCNLSKQMLYAAQTVSTGSRNFHVSL